MHKKDFANPQKNLNWIIAIWKGSQFGSKSEKMAKRRDFLAYHKYINIFQIL